MIALGVGRKLALLDFFAEAAEGLERVGFEVRVRFDELGHELIEEAQQVVEDQHLAVAGRAGTDADGRDRQRLRDLLRQLGRHGLQHRKVGSESTFCRMWKRLRVACFPRPERMHRMVAGAAKIEGRLFYGITPDRKMLTIESTISLNGSALKIPTCATISS